MCRCLACSQSLLKPWYNTMQSAARSHDKQGRTTLQIKLKMCSWVEMLCSGITCLMCITQCLQSSAQLINKLHTVEIYKLLQGSNMQPSLEADRKERKWSFKTTDLAAGLHFFNISVYFLSVGLHCANQGRLWILRHTIVLSKQLITILLCLKIDKTSNEPEWKGIFEDC